MRREHGRVKAALLLAFVSFTCVEGTALGQAGPIRLVPGQGSGQPAAPASSGQPGLRAPPGFDVAPPQRGVEPDAIAVPQSVTAVSVTAPSAESAGILGPGSGGYGPDLWTGSERGTLAALLQHMPRDAGSAALRGLMRRVLGTSAVMPEAAGDGAGADLLRLRVERLLDAGHAADAAGLIDAAGFAAAERLAPLAARAALLRFDLPAACGLAATRAGDPDAFWRRLVVFCHAASGAMDQAQLGQTLLREAGEMDPLLNWAIDKLQGLDTGPVPDPGERRPDAVSLAALRLVQGGLAIAAVERLGPAEAALLAGAEDGDPEVRLIAAERAAAAGAIPPEVLEAAYAAYPLPADAKSQPLSAAQAMPGPEARALLAQTAASETVAFVRAELVAALLETARGDPLEPALSAAMVPLLDGLPPGQESAFLAPAGLRASLLANKPESAWRWRSSLPPAGRDEAGQQAARLWGAMRLGFGANGAEGRNRPAFLATVLADQDGLGASRLVRVIRLRAALGDAVEVEEWNQALNRDAVGELPRDSASPRAVASAGVMRLAASGARRGEAALAAILAADGRPAGQISTEEVAAILHTLTEAGFQSEARQFALEAAFGAGL